MKELVLVDGSTAAVDPGSLYVPPTKWQRSRMRKTSKRLLEEVAKNAPMPAIPRNWDKGKSGTIDLDELAGRVLNEMCTDAPYLDEGLPRDATRKTAETFLEKIVSEHRKMGLTAQADRIENDLLRFVNIRYGLPEALRFMDKEELLRPDCVIPVSYLPDLTTAVPVCYFYTHEEGSFASRKEATEAIDDICRLVPNQRFANLFQLFNRRGRTLEDYTGDLIPPHVLRRMHEAAPVFDTLFIMTPYLDEVAKEWTAGNWARSCDPYLVGLKKDVPAIFLLARFSESGVFPLFNELLAGTIEFLRKHAEKLKNLDGRTYEWFEYDSSGTGRRKERFGRKLGSEMFDYTQSMLKAFEQGRLFPWLRGSVELES